MGLMFGSVLGEEAFAALRWSDLEDTRLEPKGGRTGFHLYQLLLGQSFASDGIRAILVCRNREGNSELDECAKQYQKTGAYRYTSRSRPFRRRCPISRKPREPSVLYRKLGNRVSFFHNMTSCVYVLAHRNMMQREWLSCPT